KRAIVDAATDLPAGTVYWTEPSLSAWLRWIIKPAVVLEVRETEDESLLFTIHSGGHWIFRPGKPRCWNQLNLFSVSGWDIRDADGQQVGTVQSATSLASAIARDTRGRTLLLSD